jgi:hypothetical protein
VSNPSWLLLLLLVKHFFPPLTPSSYIKRRISLAVAAGNEKGDKRWLKYIKIITDDYNNRPVTGCQMKRNEVTRENEMKLLAEKLGADDVAPVFNTRLLRSFSAKTHQALGFAFKRGDRVLLANDVNHETTARLATGGAFTKKSVVGSFGSKIYTVNEALLRANATHYVMVYSLQGLPGIWYDFELTLANRFAGSTPEEVEAVKLRQVERDAKLRAVAAAKRRKAAANRWK